MSYKQFEKRTGIPAATLERLEKTDTEIKSGQIIKICTTCGVSSDWFLGLGDKNETNIYANSGNIAIGSNNNSFGSNCESCPILQAAAKKLNKK